MKNQAGSKKKIAVLLVFIVLIVSVAGYWMLNRGSSPDFSVDVAMITGDQSGVVSLINPHQGVVYDRIQVGELDERQSFRGTKMYLSANAGNPIVLSQGNSVVTRGSSRNISDEIARRDIKVKPYTDTYDLIQVPIESGDHWLYIQSMLMHSHTVDELLRIGHEINPGVELHPIYPGDKRWFIVKKESFSENVKEEDEEPVEEDTVPIEDPIKEEEDVEEEDVEEDVKKEDELKDEELEEDYEVPVFEPTIKEVADVPRMELTPMMDEYVYRTIGNDVYVYNNNDATLYKIYHEESDLYQEIVASLDDEVVIMDFQYVDGVFYFTTPVNDTIYVYENDRTSQIEVGDKIEEWAVHGNRVYYAAMNALFKTQLDSNEFDYVYLGEETTDIHITEDRIYLANRFGATIARSVIHEMDHSLKSYGWSEIQYASNTSIVYASDSNIVLKQSLQNERDRIVIINDEQKVVADSVTDIFHEYMHLYGSDSLYGVSSNGTLYVYHLNGSLIDGLRIGNQFIHLIQ